MFFGKFVFVALSFVLMQFWPSTTMSAEDQYLPEVYATEAVIACGDDLSFDRLLSGDTAVLHNSRCAPYPVPDEPMYLGWHFVTAPDYTKSVSFFQGRSFLESHEPFVQEDGEAVRKYYGEDEYGSVKFIWPSPPAFFGHAQFALPDDVYPLDQYQYEESIPFEATTPTGIAYASLRQ